MKKFVYDLTLEAASEKEAEAKMTALTTLASALTHTELTRLAYIIKHDPVKTALAKKYLKV
ncbi:hypothetical protein [Puia dinghuensis]|uniref:Uncharacterized protein n=1 Tax=Puia dinghuensis TaxID=1792502 RepID=A0A8J2UAU8_9BACT|nr:hypothetical protein [Puia dinghuensis]GGA89945.1 hypothetical protein GCM10011511_11490 [Puia dinghuensis]